MTVEEMVKVIRQYEQAIAKTNVFRYTNTVRQVGEHPDVFGMNFEAILPAPIEQQSQIFLEQEERAELLRNVMTGNPVNEERMKALYGFTTVQLAEYRAKTEPIKKPIPPNICVLCFDDALRSQYEIALPILEKFGFGATFFIAEKQESPMGPGFEDKSVYMTWEEIADIEARGFELGNHSLHHVFGSQNMGREFNINEIKGMEEHFKEHGLAKPVSYAYPSGISNPEVVSCARECGYIWGRGNEEKGEDGIRGMTYYDPTIDNPLAICNFGDPDYYSEEVLRKRVDDVPEGMVFGLTYHGVAEHEWAGPISFQRQMEVLKELNMEVIAMKDLEKYIDPEKAYQCIMDIG
jgi:peptidoglycan/xylan/chitin deacetylase (PgdA/CDA1 family)